MGKNSFKTENTWKVIIHLNEKTLEEILQNTSQVLSGKQFEEFLPKTLIIRKHL